MLVLVVDEFKFGSGVVNGNAVDVALVEVTVVTSVITAKNSAD